jgi:hypothetical protein
MKGNANKMTKTFDKKVKQRMSQMTKKSNKKLERKIINSFIDMKAK